MSTDPSSAARVRRAKRARRLFAGAACTECGATEHLSTRPDGTVRCYEHLPSTKAHELDHPAGKANAPRSVVALRPNAHREVTELRSTLGKDAWPAADGDPVLMAGHMLAGFASLLWLLAAWLVRLGTWLRGQLGTRWWEAAPPSPLAG